MITAPLVSPDVHPPLRLGVTSRDRLVLDCLTLIYRTTFSAASGLSVVAEWNIFPCRSVEGRTVDGSPRCLACRRSARSTLCPCSYRSGAPRRTKRKRPKGTQKASKKMVHLTKCILKLPAEHVNSCRVSFKSGEGLALLAPVCSWKPGEPVLAPA